MPNETKEEFYIKPQNVVSPKRFVSDLNVLYDGGAGGWSLVKLKWDGNDCYAMRWNGNASNNGIGNPQSRGVPTWFVLPNEVGNMIEASLGLPETVSNN